jgi:parvulin-like peptidyl-prolyl isomerase
MNRVRFLATVLSLLAAGCATTQRPLARVNGDDVTAKELRAEFGRQHMALESVLVNEDDVRKYLNRVIDHRLMVQEARRAGLEEDPTVLADLAAYERKQAAAQLVRIAVKEPSVATEEEVRAAYAHAGKAKDLRELVVADEAEAKAIRARLAAGEDFEALVRAKSIAPSAKAGGRVYDFRWGAPDEVAERQALALAKGELSPAFHSEGGWTVLRLDDLRDVQAPPYAVAAPKIRSIIEKRKNAALERELIATIWAKYDAKLAGCRADAQAIAAALEPETTTTLVCSTWKGGTATLHDVAPNVNTKKLQELPEKDRPAAFEGVVRQFTSERLLEIEALARGYARLLQVVDAVERRRAALVESRLFEKYVYRDLSVTEDEAKAYYDAHRSEFADPEARHLAQIVIATKEKADEVAARLAKGERFEQLAVEVSIDQRNAAQGGEVGWYTRKDMPNDEFGAPIFALAVNSVTAPLKSPVGFHLVKILEIRPEKQYAFTDVQQDAKERALGAKHQQSRDVWLARLRSDADVEIYDSSIKAYVKEASAPKPPKAKPKHEGAGPAQHGGPAAAGMHHAAPADGPTAPGSGATPDPTVPPAAGPAGPVGAAPPPAPK